MTEFFLASSSARRVEILRSLGASFTSGGVNIDETPLPGEQAMSMVSRLAESKARTAAKSRRIPVLGADTIVTLDGRIFGKPNSAEHALEMLTNLSGRTHEVLTAISLINGAQAYTDVSTNKVTFREIHAEEARQYWRFGEPQGKAGAYAIQGRGGLFVERLEGSYSGVVGLPVFETARLFRQAGLPFLPEAD